MLKSSFFKKSQKLFLYLFEINSLKKRGYRGIRQKKLPFIYVLRPFYIKFMSKNRNTYLISWHFKGMHFLKSQTYYLIFALLDNNIASMHEIRDINVFTMKSNPLWNCMRYFEIVSLSWIYFWPGSLERCLSFINISNLKWTNFFPGLKFLKLSPFNPKRCGLLGGVLFGEMKFVLSNFLSN